MCDIMRIAVIVSITDYLEEVILMLKINNFKVEIQKITSKRVLWHDYATHRNLWSWINFEKILPYCVIRGKDFAIDQLKKELI